MAFTPSASTRITAGWATADVAPVPEWLEIEWILAGFVGPMQAAQAAYRRFVTEGKNPPSPWQELKNQIYLGSEAFVNEMQRKVQADRRLSEVPKTQRRTVARPLSWYFQTHRDRDSAVFEAFRSGAYSMREIGDHLGLHYSTISRIIRRNEGEKVKV